MCSTIAHSNNFFVKVFWVWLVFGVFLRGVWGGCMFYRSALWGECWGQDQTRQAQTWLSALTDQRHGLSSLSRNLSEQLLSSVCRNQTGPLVSARVLTSWQASPEKAHLVQLLNFLYWHKNKHIYTILSWSRHLYPKSEYR